LVKVDIQTLSGGHLCSRIIGSSVVANENDAAIGTIDDLLVSSDAQQPFAVLSIGSFLGMETHLVVVPYETG
jgi:hypothetical protein